MSLLNPIDNGRRIAGWTAIIAAPVCWLQVILYLMATGWDTGGLFDPAKALSMSGAAQGVFRWSMFCDMFGWYLPFVVIGTYLWSRLRPRFGMMIDVATVALFLDVVMGISSASIQLSAFGPLAAAHAGGNAMVQTATESVWLGVVSLAEQGLWWMECAVMTFWALVVGRASIAAGMKYGRLLMVVGVLYSGWFITGFFEIAELGEYLEIGVLAVFPIWMVLAGISLLKQGSELAVPHRFGGAQG